MFLFILQTRIVKDEFITRVYGDPISSVSGVIDNHLKNKEELKKYLSSILNGHDNLQHVIKSAELCNINKMECKYSSSNFDLQNEAFHRTFSLTSVLLRSIRNKDGSYDVRYSKVTTIEHQFISFLVVNGITNRGLYAIYQLAESGDKRGDVLRVGKSISELINRSKKDEITQVYNEMVTTTINQKANTKHLFILNQ